MSESRTKNSVKNYLFATIGQFVNLLARFVARSIFIYTLGKEYLGLSGVFSSILQVLNLAELGVGVAITYSLYKPIVENDEDKIVTIMDIFKKVYISIGLFVSVVGLFLTPYLNFFVKDLPEIPHCSLIYALYVIDTAIPYFFSYKAIFITAKQQNYIVTNNQYLFKLLCTFAQCVFLLITHDYIIFIIIQILATLFSGIRIYLIANKKYPFLEKKAVSKLDPATKEEIKNNISSMFIHKVGGVVIYSTDSLLLSKIFGLIAVGIYSNYILIINAVQTVINQFFQSITASVGNLGTTEDMDHQIKVYKQILFINFWMYSFSTIALACLLKPFISLWLGTDFLMNKLSVVFIVINFYLNGMRECNITFLNAYGLAPKYKYMPLYEITINLVSSIVLAKIIGPAGIFVGTTVSTLATGFWIEPKILFKYSFKDIYRNYIKEYITYAAVTVLAFFITSEICSLVYFEGFFGFVVIMSVVAILPNVLYILCFFKKEEFSKILAIVNIFR